MSKHFQENKEVPAYYLTLYKLKGHTTWRSHLAGSTEAFLNEKKGWEKNQNPPTVTETKVFRVDRVTGKIKEL